MTSPQMAALRQQARWLLSTCPDEFQDWGTISLSHLAEAAASDCDLGGELNDPDSMAWDIIYDEVNRWEGQVPF